MDTLEAIQKRIAKLEADIVTMKQGLQNFRDRLASELASGDMVNSTRLQSWVETFGNVEGQIRCHELAIRELTTIRMTLED